MNVLIYFPLYEEVFGQTRLRMSVKINLQEEAQLVPMGMYVMLCRFISIAIIFTQKVITILFY